MSLFSIAVFCNSHQLSSCFPRAPVWRNTNFYLDSSSVPLPRTPISPPISIFFSLGEPITSQRSSQWRWRNPLRREPLKSALWFSIMSIFIGEVLTLFDPRSLKWEKRRPMLTSSVRFRLRFAEIAAPSLTSLRFLPSIQSSDTSIPESPPPLDT